MGSGFIHFLMKREMTFGQMTMSHGSTPQKYDAKKHKNKSSFEAGILYLMQIKIGHIVKIQLMNSFLCSNVQCLQFPMKVKIT